MEYLEEGEHHWQEQIRDLCRHLYHTLEDAGIIKNGVCVNVEKVMT